MKESKTVHVYFFHGHWVEGYGPSMDPHRCGHDELCVTIVYEREVSDWTLLSETIVRPEEGEDDGR